ncbi:sensor histidine kinase [Aquimarina litoralis]|uniref:sensor histidine kinase n=1 Tax=Aquimarina litoralis TaxID=584605 RepID=UPI001C57608D|nr:sensor histidine kinase [Aquimarina litoralis]MBW1296491.1 GHKL domain-containing protein [Aquimarina litoralis]
MTRSIRFFSQIGLWAVIWIFLSILQKRNDRFLIENSVVFGLQVALIGLLIFYIAKQFLFKKKYILFVIISIILIFTSAFISSYIFSGPKMHEKMRRPMEANKPDTRLRRNGPMRPPRGVNPPSIFMVHFSNLMIAYLIATFLETFLFAQRKEEEMIRSKSENLQTELKLLKSQINPHFLFNSLNNIYALSVIDSNKTQQSISYLSEMLRYVLYECDRPFVTIKKELAYIENYIKLFSLKSSKPYNIQTKFDILDPSVLIAPMLFIPFIENAFKHSNIEKPDSSFINIVINATLEHVDFKIENSIPKESIVKDKIGGIGLENVKKRLSILYSGKHQLNIDTKDQVFKVQLYINSLDHA